MLELCQPYVTRFSSVSGSDGITASFRRAASGLLNVADTIWQNFAWLLVNARTAASKLQETPWQCLTIPSHLAIAVCILVNVLPLPMMSDVSEVAIKGRVCQDHNVSFLHTIPWLDASKDMTSAWKVSFSILQGIRYGLSLTDKANIQAIQAGNSFLNLQQMSRSLNSSLKRAWILHLQLTPTVSLHSLLEIGMYRICSLKFKRNFR